MQELSWSRHLSLEKNGTQEVARSPNLWSDVSPHVSSNLASVCQRQVKELVGELPLLGAWIVYRDGSHLRGERHRVAKVCEERSGFDSTILSELESEVWRYGSGDRLFDKALSNVYLYPLLSRGGNDSELQNFVSLSRGITYLSFHLSNGNYFNHSQDLDEYLLLWANCPLSSGEQQAIQQRVQLLNDYLVIGRDYSRQQQKIQLLEQAIGRTEHQLRNYLATIGLYAQNLIWGLSDPGLKEQAMTIGNTVSDIRANLSQLFNCSQPNKNRVFRHNFVNCITDILKVLEAKIVQKNIQVKWPNKSLEIECDFWQIKQAFENILANAIEFSPRGGAINFQWQEVSDEVLIRISDRGPGFSAEDLKNAFTPYYSKRPGGTGLGLAIAQKIIWDRQGSIWLENLPEGGAQVSVILPRYAQLTTPQITNNQ